ncbi:hypothetical protein Q31b_15710 [Novipirellula aureliae]|uniref:Endonuclease/exonuclease/phosphatase domain-containing protein n=1 Tax=Novipirellula aureliae TaxID=2527966 RepID=A0A5C6E969_9BACT|nr:endonuclease/exonuclease/phosphatase family protein [Novipirellula aureliae]TWU44036.1 hypothetical protein Q31b_15710 [Novipirellula aureliae]
MGLLSRSSRGRSSRSVFSYIPLIRWIGPLFSIGVIVVSCLAALTGRIDLTVFDTSADDQEESTELVSRSGDRGEGPLTTAPRSMDSIRIATFNIQMFGDRKSSTRTIAEVPGVDVMGTISSIVGRFDLIAIQEVRDDNMTVVRRLVDLVNADGGSYTASVSAPVGDARSGDLQSYAFVWDSTRVQMMSEPYVVQDTADRMHREPMVGTFRTILDPSIHDVPNREPFSFTIINVQNDPRGPVTSFAADRTNLELNVLDDVFVRVRDFEFQRTGEEDCILLGDLNAGPSQLEELSRIPNVESVAGDIKTDVLRRSTLDHILLDRAMTTEFTGRTGVIDFRQDLGLTEAQSKLISDHLPLWAEFSVYEAERIPAVARRQP